MSRPGTTLLALVIALSVASQLVRGLAADDAQPSRPEAPTKVPHRKSPGKLFSAPPIKDLRLRDAEPDSFEQIEEALARLTDVKFAEVPLEDVVSHFRTLHHINIFIDRGALEEAEIALDRPITMELAGVRFESALNLLLEPIGLDFVLQNEVLKITTREKAAQMAETRTFEIQNLIDAGHTPDELIESIVACVEPESWSEAGGAGSIAHSGSVLICRQTQRVQAEIAALLIDLDELAEAADEHSPEAAGDSVVSLKVYQTFGIPSDELAKLLPSLVAIESWGDSGASIHAVSGALLVRQTARVHREIDNLLKQLRPASGGRSGSDSPLPSATSRRGQSSQGRSQPKPASPLKPVARAR